MQYPSDVKHCIKDCLLGLIYKKVDLIDFFQNDCGCTRSDMAAVDASLTKATIVDTVLRNLHLRDDKGMVQMQSIIRNILQWGDFGSHWFRNGTLDAAEAQKSIERLKKLLGEKTKLDEAAIDREKRRKEAESKQDKRRSFEQMRTDFNELVRMNEHAQKRGFAFEKFLNDMFQHAKVEVYKAYKLVGEQIDGSFKYEGENYICEAKWQDETAVTNQLYTFAGKILSNTMYPRGAFFSVNGFAPSAVEMISMHKSPNLVLVDGSDLMCVLEELITLPELLSEKIRYAQTRACIYVSASEILKK